MNSTTLVGVLFGFYPQPYHAPFLDRLRGSYGVEVRYAQGDWGEHIQRLADDFVELGAHVVVTMDTPSMNAVAGATTTIPTVSLVCRIPPGMRSDHNLTGLASKEIDARRQLHILLALLEANGADISPIGVLWNADNPAMEPHLQEIEQAGAAYEPRVSIRSLPLHGPAYAFEPVLNEIGDAKGMVVLEDPVVVYHCGEVASFAAGRRVPAMCESPNFVDLGALACYGPDRLAMFERMGDYVDRIVREDLRPGHLPPVEEAPSRLFINLAAAGALGMRQIPDLLDGVSWERSAPGD